jgi:hypothetical protein
MRRTAFAIAAITVAIAVASICGIQRGHCEEERQASGDFAISFRCPQQVAWDDGMRLAMRWDDARKKMLFDRKAAGIRCWLGSCEMEFEATQDVTAEYDFDAGHVFAAKVASPDGISELSANDGRIHFGMDWSDIENKFEFRMSFSPDTVRDPNLFIPIVWLAD